MKITTPLCVCFLLCSAASSSQPTPPKNIPLEQIRIDPDNASAGTASEIYDRIDYIPLETTKESLFGQIDQLEITPKYFIILDNATNALLFFNKDGSFHHKITKLAFHDKIPTDLPPSPGFRNRFFSSFMVDPDKDRLIVQHALRSDLEVFDFQGTFIEKLKIPANTGDFVFLKGHTRFFRQVRPVSSRSFASYAPFDVSGSRNESPADEHFFPVNFNAAALSNDILSGVSGFSRTGNPYECFYRPDFEYNVYGLDSTGINHQYQFIFPQQYSLPENFGYDSAYANRRHAYLKDKNMFLVIRNFAKIDDYLLFGVSTALARFFILHNQKTGNNLVLNKVSGDEKSSFLPANLYGEILACDGKSIFSSLPSLFMFDTQKQTADKKPTYDKVLTEYFKTQSRKSNPVIVQLTPRKDL